MTPKVAVIYYSATGTVHALADGVARVPPPEPRCGCGGSRSWHPTARLRIHCGGGTPTSRRRSPGPRSAFTSEFNRHGGSEATILSLANVFYHWGALIVPLGHTDPVVHAAGGNPYGTSATGPPTGDGPDAAALEAARYQGRRLAQITMRLLGGSRVTDAAAGNGNAHPTGEARTSQTA